MQKLQINSDKNSILNSALVGIEFEFYSKYSLKETNKIVSALLNREIRIETKAHSDFQPTAEVFKMEPDMSGGKGLIEMVTGAMPYRNARIVIIKMLNWIKENGYTTSRSSIHLNISLDPSRLEDKNTISKMNILKFILEFNEDQVYKLFPNRKGSIYAKSIKWIMPKYESYVFSDMNVNINQFNFPDTKYYGINFSKRMKNYLEFRYVGGKDYEKNMDNILYLLDRFIVQLWKSCNSNEFTVENKIELKRILSKSEPIIEILRDHTKLRKYYPKVILMVDLQERDDIIRLQWERIKHRVVKLITLSGMTEGIINYDSDISKIQIKDGKFPVCYELKHCDLVDCQINGNVQDCDIYGCDIDDSSLENCNIFLGTDIKESKIKSSYVHGSCKATNCYVFGVDGIFKGKMIGGIFREGMMTDDARFEDTEIVVSKKIDS